MGTNYYWIHNHCDKCNRHDVLHIGKSSGGWAFSLHVIPEMNINDLDDWKVLWHNRFGRIEDEYEKVITTTSMIDIITNRRYKVRHPLSDFCIKHGAGSWDCMLGYFS